MQVGPAFGFAAANVISTPAGIAVSSDGTPYVAWERFNRTTGLTAIFVSFFDGSQWIDLPQVNTRIRHAGVGDIEIDSTGMPYVAWTGSFGLYRPRQLSVSRFNGTSWVEIGGPLNVESERNAVSPSLELTQFDEPIVSWDERFNFPLPDESFVMMWDGLDWQPIGDPLPNSIRSLQLGYRKNGTQVLYAAILPRTYSTISEEIQLRRWNGVRWRTMVTIPPNDPSQPFAVRFGMQLQANGLPQIYWTEGPTPALVPWLVRVKGRDLQYFDTSQLTAGHDFAIRGNSLPFFTRRFGSDQLEVTQFRFGGPTPEFVTGSWEEHPQTPFPGTGYISSASHDGHVYVAYYDFELRQREQIVVRRF